jgi:hypothetical protein
VCNGSAHANDRDRRWRPAARQCENRIVAHADAISAGGLADQSAWATIGQPSTGATS